MRNSLSTLLAACCLGLLLNACGGKTVPTEYAPVAPASMFIEQEQPFCGHDGADKLSLGYYGSNPRDTTVYLYIICQKGDTVFRDEWPGKWFLGTDNPTSDSAAIAEIHQKMHLMIEGKMPATDSLTQALPANQPVFSYALEGHFSKRVAYSATEHVAKVF